MEALQWLLDPRGVHGQSCISRQGHSGNLEPHNVRRGSCQYPHHSSWHENTFWFPGQQYVVRVLAVRCAFLSATSHYAYWFSRRAALQVGEQARPIDCHQISVQEKRGLYILLGLKTSLYSQTIEYFACNLQGNEISVWKGLAFYPFEMTTWSLYSSWESLPGHADVDEFMLRVHMLVRQFRTIDK